MIDSTLAYICKHFVFMYLQKQTCRSFFFCSRLEVVYKCGSFLCHLLLFSKLKLYTALSNVTLISCTPQTLFGVHSLQLFTLKYWWTGIFPYTIVDSCIVCGVEGKMQVGNVRGSAMIYIVAGTTIVRQ